MCLGVPIMPGGVLSLDRATDTRCLVDVNHDKLFEASMFAEHEAYFPLKGKVPYSVAIKDTLLGEARDNIQRELIYQGYAQGVLRFAYREYVGDMARPAFSQDVTYEKPGEGPTIVGFKGARMRVIDANNTTIRYVIEKGFD